MFANTNNFNRDLNNWDVSKVEDMTNIFSNSEKFNGDISNWNTQNVVNMTNAFKNAENFNRDISSWVLSSAVRMNKMFYGAKKFNFGTTNYLSSSTLNWDTSKVVDCSYMFALAINFAQNINHWDLDNAIKTKMFKGAFEYQNNAFNTGANNYRNEWDLPLN